MGKYEPITRFLKEFSQDAWDASLAEIEAVLGFRLPPSARKHASWWGNSRKSHSQAKAWIDAGWFANPQEIDLREGRVRFERGRSSGRRTASLDLEKLRKDAMFISGISDPEALERAALTAFIQREAGRQLILMGGTMPDLVVPPRERPTW